MCLDLISQFHTCYCCDAIVMLREHVQSIMRLLTLQQHLSTMFTVHKLLSVSSQKAYHFKITAHHTYKIRRQTFGVFIYQTLQTIREGTSIYISSWNGCHPCPQINT